MKNRCFTGIIGIFLSSTIMASDEDILSKKRLEIFDLSQKQVEENAKKLEKDWINPVTYSYTNILGGSVANSAQTATSSISVNQPIFKSGGIYQAIKYANANKQLQTLDVKASKKEMIEQAYTLLFQIHKTKLSIAKQELLVKNAQIDIATKKEQVINGLLDTATLDNAILDANVKKNALLDLQYTLDDLIISFSNLSDQSYENFELPEFSMIQKEKFLHNNIYIDKAQAQIQNSKWVRYMSVSKYLPTVNFTYDYTKYHDDAGDMRNQDQDRYGFNIVIPLDTRTLSDIQANKIEHLKSQKEKETIKLEQSNFLETKAKKIEILQKRKNIAKSDVKLYNSLLKQMIELQQAGLKTQSDVQTLKNSKKIKDIDIQILDIEKQIELLGVYARVHG